MTTLTKRYRFASSHRLASGSLSEEQNREVFGKCANPFGHGHNYVLEVSVRGTPDSDSGLTLGRDTMDEWVTTSVVERLDYTDMGAEVPEFATLVPTAENILRVIAKWLHEGWTRRFPEQPSPLAGLLLEETPRNSFRLDALQDGHCNV